MLTLKTKEKFYEWLIPELRKLDYVDETYYDKELIDGFYQLPLVCQQALVVDFFDSVGIYIHIEPYTYNERGLTEKALFKNYVVNYKDIDEQNSYLERGFALSKAISKADELFNLKNE